MRLRSKLFANILLFSCIFILSLSAQAAEWQLVFSAPQGLPSGWINQLSIHPTKSNIFYAATEGAGFIVSENEGKSWIPKNQGLTTAEEGTVSGFQVRCMALDPVNPDTIYIGMAAFGVFKSTDAGNTWKDINSTLEDTFTKVLIMHPKNTNTVYLGTDGGGVYRYDVANDEWLESISGLKNTYIRALVFDPNDAKTIYVATDGGVSKTADGAEKWVPASNGLTSRTVFCLAIDPKNPKVLYAGTETGGLFKTSDSGANWEAVGGDIWTAKLIMEGLAAPTDDIPSTPMVTSIAVNPVNTSIVYAANPNGVYRSADAGKTWEQINTGLTNTTVKSLAVSNSQPVRLYAGTSDGKLFMYKED